MTNESDKSKASATRVAEAGRRKEWTGAVVNPPIWRASTHLYDSIAEMRARSSVNEDGVFYYGRRGSPTQWSLADALTELEPGAAGTMLLPSGAAAVNTALLSVLRPGDELLVTDSTYDPTRIFANSFLKKWGVTTRYYDPHIGADIAGLFSEKTRAVLMESPGSLTFEVQDVPAICKAARARKIVTLIDNTWATPLFFPALAAGVDIAILACTKYIVGHSDVMLGSITTSDKYWGTVRRTVQSLGQVVSPDDAYLAARGLRTLDVRLRRHQENALAVAQWLEERDDVARVLYPALPSRSDHELWRRDFAGASGLFAFELAAGGEAERAAFIDALDHFGIGYSWGGYESLAVPADPAATRSVTEWPDNQRLVRLHIGLEDPADLITDLAKGFAAFHKLTG